MKVLLTIAATALFAVSVTPAFAQGAGAATQITVHTGVEDVSIDSDIVARGVLQGDVAVAGEAVGLRVDFGG